VYTFLVSLSSLAEIRAYRDKKKAVLFYFLNVFIRYYDPSKNVHYFVYAYTPVTRTWNFPFSKFIFNYNNNDSDRVRSPKVSSRQLIQSNGRTLHYASRLLLHQYYRTFLSIGKQFVFSGELITKWKHYKYCLIYFVSFVFVRNIQNLNYFCF